METQTVALPELAAETGAALADELLLTTAATTKVAKVRSGRSLGWGARQSHSARAWTTTGDVD